jgi:hypothetical protein
MPKKLWVKGQSGNPKGRPKSVFNFLKECDLQLAEVDPADKLKRTNGQIAAAQFVYLMKQGSIRACNEYLDRKLGKPPQALAIADLRAQNRDELIAGILESVKVMKESDGDEEKPLIQ